MRVQESVLQELAQRKLAMAGLSTEHAGIVADVLVFADAYGIHSHGVMRTEYYAERIVKGGINTPAELLGREDRAMLGDLPR